MSGDGNNIAAYFVFDENRIESEIVTPVTANDKEPSDTQDNEGDLVDNEGEHLAATQKRFVIRARSWHIINFENSSFWNLLMKMRQ